MSYDYFSLDNGGRFYTWNCFFIIFSFSKKTNVLALISMCISIVASVCFVVDITIEPVKNIGNNVIETQAKELNSYIEE